MRILTVIPARGGSKGVPGKNTKNLGGKSLIAYSIEAAQLAGLEHIVVNSDSDVILEIAKKYGAEVYKRPEQLGTDDSKSIDVIAEMLQGKYSDFDAVLLLQATYPFREKGFINSAIEKFSKDNLDSLVSVLPIPHQFNPHWVFEEDNKGHLKIATGDQELIPRRQELPNAYYRDGGIYITKKEVLLNHSFIGGNLGYVKSNPKNYVNIDTLNDWKLAEEMIQIWGDWTP